jgi:hypothetical protein
VPRPETFAADEPWDVRILRAIDAGVDESLIAERLKLSPTERIEAMRSALVFSEDARRAMNGHRLP